VTWTLLDRPLVALAVFVGVCAVVALAVLWGSLAVAARDIHMDDGDW
jgi:hypothetical protein